MQRLLVATNVKAIRVVSSQLGGRMLAETEAPDRQTLEKFFEVNYVNCEWIMPIDLDALPQGIIEF